MHARTFGPSEQVIARNLEAENVDFIDTVLIGALERRLFGDDACATWSHMSYINQNANLMVSQTGAGRPQSNTKKNISSRLPTHN